MNRLWLALGALCFSTVLAAADRDIANLLPFTAERMWALKRLGEPAITPDGRRAIVPVTTNDIAENRGLTDLWIVPLDGSAATQLTSDKANDTQPTVSPDGKWVAFVSKRGDDTENQLYVIAIDGGEARRVTRLPTGVSPVNPPPSRACRATRCPRSISTATRTTSRPTGSTWRSSPTSIAPASRATST
jgi:hypothetical protein